MVLVMHRAVQSAHSRAVHWHQTDSNPPLYGLFCSSFRDHIGFSDRHKNSHSIGDRNQRYWARVLMDCRGDVRGVWAEGMWASVGIAKCEMLRDVGAALQLTVRGMLCQSTPRHCLELRRTVVLWPGAGEGGRVRFDIPDAEAGFPNCCPLFNAPDNGGVGPLCPPSGHSQ